MTVRSGLSCDVTTWQLPGNGMSHATIIESHTADRPLFWLKENLYQIHGHLFKFCIGENWVEINHFV
jgi:hypothetical protein